jgi:hypothetical protein
MVYKIACNQWCIIDIKAIVVEDLGTTPYIYTPYLPFFSHFVKRQTSQCYIICILQHFATKLRNITNFVMLFQAVMKFLSRLVYRSKFCSLGNRSIVRPRVRLFFKS